MTTTTSITEQPENCSQRVPFKVGDKVIYVSPTRRDMETGSIYEVVGVYNAYGVGKIKVRDCVGDSRFLYHWRFERYRPTVEDFMSTFVS